MMRSGYCVKCKERRDFEGKVEELSNGSRAVRGRCPFCSHDILRLLPLQDVTTREFCGRCHRVSPIGFHARDDIWDLVAGRHWKDSILCIMCFAQLGDEKHVVWEEGIKLYAVSYATHHAGRGRTDTSPMEVDRLRDIVKGFVAVADEHDLQGDIIDRAREAVS